MGVYRLMQLIKEKGGDSSKQIDIRSYKGKSIAIDASLTIYQYLIGTQSIKNGETINEMHDFEGNKTAHLMGILNRSIYLMTRGIKPCWVFDGCPPEAKTRVIQDRQDKREDAFEKMEVALNQGDMEVALKYANRTAYITEKMMDDAKMLLELLGLPYIQVILIHNLGPW